VDLTADTDLTSPQRQSIWAIVLLALRTVREIGVVQLVLGAGFVLTRVPSLLWFALAVVFVALVLFVIAGLQWWRYTFVVKGTDLLVSRGVLQRQELSVPLERVQSVSLEQKLLHRFVSLVQVSLDTAGTVSAEFVIDAVEKPVAQALQRVVANYRLPVTTEVATGSTPPPPERVLLKHDAKRIVQVALTQAPWTGLALVAPIFAGGGELVELLPFDLPTVEGPSPGWKLLWYVPVALAVGFVFSVLLNMVRLLLTHWDLTLRSSSAGLRRDAGLFSTSSLAAPVPRVQVIDTRQGFLARRIGLHTVRLDTIGLSKIDLPGCTSDQVVAIRAVALGDSAGVTELDQPVSNLEVFKQTRNSMVVALVCGVPMWFVVGWWALLVAPIIPFVWLRTRRAVRLRRWGVSSDSVADHQQLIGWHRREILLRKLNEITVRQSLFERKRDLATVKLSTAAGAISIGMIPLAQANELRDFALYIAETDRRVWM